MRISWQTGRRVTNEILGAKGLTAVLGNLANSEEYAL